MDQPAGDAVLSSVTGMESRQGSCLQLLASKQKISTDTFPKRGAAEAQWLCYSAADLKDMG